MKTSITIILTILMLFTSTSGLWYAVDVQNSSDDMTPIARIENDDYVTYANRGKNEDVEVETLDLTSKEYIVTITVMTTATGDIERGNYVESKPIANALVRLDGIPRYTDKQGKIKAYVFNKYVELYVERSGYNPYIEIIDASAGDKVVNLKKPSDDIEIYSAMFEYQGKMFNLLSQPCYVLRGIDFVFSVLTVESNVEVDKLMFYVNGELTRLTFGNKMYFTDKDFDSYGNEDKFTIRICYAGVYSKYQEIFINFNDYNHEEIKAEILRGLEQQSRQQSLYANSNTGLEIGNDQSNIGSIGSINAPSEMTIYEMILDEIMPTDISYSPEFGQFKLKLSITPDFYNGTFEFLIGVEMTPKWVKEVNEKIQNKRDKVKLDEMLYEQAKAKAQMDESEQANIENQKKFDEAEANWKEAKQKFDNTGYLDDKYFDAMRDMYMYESIMNDEYARLTETEDYEAYVQSVNDYEQSVSAYQQVLGEIQDEYDGLSNALDNAEQQFKSASKDASKSLLQYLIDKDKFNQTVEKIEDFFVNKNSSVHTGASFKIDLDFAFMGKVIYSYRDNSFVKASVYCEIKFKVIFSYQWLVTIPTPFPIIVPVFITIQGNIGGRIELTFLENNELLSIENILDDIAISLLFGLRVDGGIGVAASNITAGPYGQVDFKMQFRPNMKLTFQWGAGLKIQFLDFEVEFGYQSDEQTIWSKEDKAALAQVARLAKASAIDGEISENQLFDRIYHASRPQLIGLEDGRKMLIWIEDDADRDIYNSSVVKYSIFDNGEWSSPKAICDDGRGDYAFDVCVKDGDVFVAMQKVNRLMTEQDDLYDTLKSLDIFVSKFDSKTGNFGAVEQITNDNKYDAAPQFAVVDGSSNVTLTWLSNTNDDFMGLTGENVINATQYNGYSWSNSEEIFRNSKLIFSYSCAVENGKTALAIREDKDGDLFTFDSTTYVIKNGSKVFESDTAINPQFINLSDTVAMLYYKEGKLVSTDDFISEEVVVDGIATQEFNISKSGETPALFYESYDGEVERGYCSLNIDGVDYSALGH
ncbi:MAG: hypothetical protein K2H36_03955 [Clostridia bacterium]|nr:hypothetical protein [Clostridia bacterium]